jgi:DNA-binding transcriptional LysR family regulator
MDILDVDLNLLVVLDALLRTRSVSAAARRLNMSQPATSFALKRLRTTFGDPLFVRTSRGIHPTPNAERLAIPLTNILEGIRSDLLHRPTFDPQVVRRAITFNMHDVGELVFLAPILKRVSELAPGIEIFTVNKSMAELDSALRSGDVDLAVGHFPELHGAALFQQRLFTHSFVCIVRKDHPTIGKEMTRRQFLDGAHAIVHEAGRTGDFLSSELEAQGLKRRVVLNIEHYLAVPMILTESDLIFTVPYAIGQELAKLGDIKLVRPPFKSKPRIVKQFWHSRFHHDDANRWIRGIVADLFLDSSRDRAKNPRR